jgi:hypothetical protein
MLQHASSIVSRSLLLSILLLALPIIVHGDGGRVQLQQKADSFLITVFAAPAPLRAGQVDISVLIQNFENDQPVLDAQVQIILRGESGMTVRAEATRAEAKNKLLYATMLNLPESGQWQIEVEVKRGAKNSKVAGFLVVSPAWPLFLSHWRLLVLPPFAIALFILNQRLRSQMSARRNR